MKGITSVVVFLLAHKISFGILSEYFIDESDIPELNFMNTSIDPCEDFYEYTCGNYKNIYPLQNDELNRDNFLILEEELTKIDREILELPNRLDDPVALKKVRAAYEACMDDYENENYFLKYPELEVIKEFGGFPLVEPSMNCTKFSWNEIGDMVTRYGVPLMFSIQSYYDMLNSSEMVVYLSTDPMGIPEQLTFERSSYDQIIEEGLLGLKGQAVSAMELLLRNISSKINRVYSNQITTSQLYLRLSNVTNFMVGIYSGGYIEDGTVVDSLPPLTVTLDELNEWTKKSFGDTIELDWIEYIGRIYQNSGVKITGATKVSSYTGLNTVLYGVLNWYRMNEPGIVKSMALLRIFLYMAVDSDAETREAFNVYLKSIGKRVYPRPEYCTRKLIDASYTASLSFALTYEYQLRYFNINKFNKALEMYKDIRESFLEIISESSWMDEDSRKSALNKARNTITLLGFPEVSSNKTLLDKFYENVGICKWNNYNNTKNIRAFRQAYQLSQLQVRDRECWEKSPFDVNAYYNRPNNKITFPVAVLNYIFFSGNISIFDYGRIGMILGHEMTHGFDESGSKYNEYGAVNSSWWSVETTENFKNRTQCFKDQYSQYYIPEIDSNVNGDKTLDENLADNGGLRSAYRSVQKMLSRLLQSYRSTPYSQRYTTEQLFFIGFGTMWCSNETPAYLEATQTNCTSVCHTNSKWRVNGVVSNMEEFAQAFSCPAGSRMNPENKCRLW